MEFGIRGGIALAELLGTGVRVIFIAGEYVCLEGGTGRHCASRPGAILTENGYQGVIDPEDLKRLLRQLDGEEEPDPKENRFAAGAGNIGPFEKGSLSTTGEEREEDIIENFIGEDIFGDRLIGIGSNPVIPNLDPTSPTSPCGPFC